MSFSVSHPLVRHPPAWRRLARSAALLGLILMGRSAYAADYVFPGALPPGCSGSNGAYACGVLTLGSGDTVTIAAPIPASITFSGALTVGDGAQINAGGLANNLFLVTHGVFTLGASVTANAHVTGTAAINLGTGSSVGGNITASTTTGVVTLAANSMVAGYISGDSGAITIGDASLVGGSVSTLAGVIVLTTHVKVGGNISSRDGGISVGDGSVVCGNVASTGAGVVTLTTNVKVGGSVSTSAGALTMGAGSTVGANVLVSGAGVVTLTGVLVGGDVRTTVGAITLTNSQVRGSATPAIAVTMTSSAVNVTDLVIPPACIPAVTSASAARFECLETTANKPWNGSARKPLYTKLAGTPFTFDLAALKSDGALETGYVAAGDRDKQVSIELVDGSGTAVCSARTAISPSTSQTLSFAAADQGRKTVASITLARSYADLRCRVTDSTLAAPLVSCSSDNFSVRPGAVTLMPVPAMAMPPSAQGLPRIKTGAAFTLRAATATAASDGYTGLLSLDSSRLSAQAPDQDARQASGGAVGLLSPASLVANAAPANNASYDEVGYLYLGPGAYRDAAFTAVDQVGDCVADSSSVVASGGRFGCNVGNDMPVALGRFHPDHFSVVPRSLVAACVSGVPFTYFGQDGFTTTFTLAAKNAAEGVTRNYAGVFARLNLTDYPSYGFSASTLPVGARLAGGAAAPTGTWINGVAAVSAMHQVSRPSSPSAETAVTVSATPSDGETAAVTAAAVGLATAMRYGRFSMQNVYGSELLDLPVPLEAQYWTGSFYATNLADSCTAVGASAVTMGNYQKQLSACKTQIAPAGRVVLVAGKLPAPGWVLSKPGVNNGGSVDLALTLGSTATGKSCVGPAEAPADAASLPWFGANPSARASFGIYKSSVIYRRENY